MTCLGILAKDEESTFVSKVCIWTAPVRDRINLEVTSVKEKDASMLFAEISTFMNFCCVTVFCNEK